MNLINKTIEKLELVIKELINQNKVVNYVITVQLYMSLQIKLLVEKVDNSLIDFIFNSDSLLLEYKDMIDISLIETKDCDEEDLKLIFEIDNKNFTHINYSIRRAYNDLIELPKNVETPCPVITFYSYKGGVGRTTLLYTMALNLANKGKKVVVLDCDFEAPGFTNYFGYRFGKELQEKNGFVEYILDRQFLISKNEEYIKENLISQIPKVYSYKVGSEYTKGDIRLVKTGNYESQNLKNYLESLARLDFGNVNLFKQFLFDIQQAFDLKWENSVILIDSRTGFTDTFATLYSLSQLIVGVFGTNTQNTTGMEFFVDTFLNNQNEKQEKEILFVKSYAANDSSANALYENIKDYIKSKYSNHTEKYFLGADNPHQDRFFAFKKHEELAKIGEKITLEEDEIAIANLIIEDIYLLNKKLFEQTFLTIENIVKKKLPKNENYLKINNPENQNIKTVEEKIAENKDNPTFASLQRNILENLFIPLPYSEMNPTNEKNATKFYFRRNMPDFFNWDKFIISGSKGAGKTFIYEALSIKFNQQDLCYLVDKNPEDYFFINIIAIHKKGEKHFTTNKFTENEKNGINDFFERFWFVYVANQILSNPEILKSIKQTNLILDLSWTFNLGFDSKNEFVKIIQDEKMYANVVLQIKKLNQNFVKTNKYLIILFDQLDHVVEPSKWKLGIAPLIKLWRSNPFSNILPKIFLRTDLLSTQLTAVNSEELFRRTISIEWTKEETFSYFIGIQILKKPELINFFETQNISNEIIELLKIWHKDEFPHDQIPLDREILEPLVNAFFGESPHRSNPDDLYSFGVTYNWFENNLKDGNNDVSLRPFIWMMDKAKQEAIKDIDNEQNYIIGAKYFADFNTLEYVGEKYFDDLAREEGNDVILLPFKEFLGNERNIKRMDNYRLNEFEELIKTFKKKKNINYEIKELIEFLVYTGITREKRIFGGKYKNYEFPFLYKYFLLFSNKKD